MRDRSANRYARRHEDHHLTKSRATHFHVADSVFTSRQDAAQFARSIGNDLRGKIDPNGFISYVVSVADAVEEMLRVVPCDLEGCYD